MTLTKHRLAKDKKFETSYYIIRGKSKGNTVLVTAGIHGNEKAGILAANKLLDMMKKGDLRIHNGILIIVPIVNQHAYHRKIRGIPDLNRTFPSKTNDTARHPLSAALFRLTKRFHPSWYIDLHEANGLSNINSKVLGQTLILNPGSKAIPAARRIVEQINRSIDQSERYFNLRVSALPGSGRTAAFRLLKSKAITVETCWSLPLADRVKFQVKILHKLLHESGLMTKNSAPPLKRPAAPIDKQKQVSPGKPPFPGMPFFSQLYPEGHPVLNPFQICF